MDRMTRPRSPKVDACASSAFWTAEGKFPGVIVDMAITEEALVATDAMVDKATRRSMASFSGGVREERRRTQAWC